MVRPRLLLVIEDHVLPGVVYFHDASCTSRTTSTPRRCRGHFVRCCPVRPRLDHTRLPSVPRISQMSGAKLIHFTVQETYPAGQ